MSEKVEKDDGGRAFPGIVIASPGDFAHAPGGMSLRDWFAGMAMQGYCSNPDWQSSYEGIADSAVKQADALIEELKK